MSYKAPSDALWEASKIQRESHPVLGPEQRALLEYEEQLDGDRTAVARTRTVALWRFGIFGVLAGLLLLPMPVNMLLRLVVACVLAILALISLADARRARLPR